MRLAGIYLGESNPLEDRAHAQARGRQPLEEHEQKLVDEVQALSKVQDESKQAGKACRPWLRLLRDEPAFDACMKASGRLGGAVFNSKRAFKFIANAIGNEDQEVFGALYLDTHLQVRGLAETARGNIDSVQAPVGPTLRMAIVTGAHAIVIFHCHPTRLVAPSEGDRQVTRVFKDASEAVDILLVDHLILGGQKRYYSFADAGKLS